MYDAFLEKCIQMCLNNLIVMDEFCGRKESPLETNTVDI